MPSNSSRDHSKLPSSRARQQPPDVINVNSSNPPTVQATKLPSSRGSQIVVEPLEAEEAHSVKSESDSEVKESEEDQISEEESNASSSSSAPIKARGGVSEDRIEEMIDEKLGKMRDEILEEEFKGYFADHLEDSLDKIKEYIQKNAIDKVPYIYKLKHILETLDEHRESIDGNHQELAIQFAQVNVDVKEVYEQIEIEHAKTLRERADLKLVHRSVMEEIGLVKNQSDLLLMKTVRFDEFLEDMVSQTEMRLALEL